MKNLPGTAALLQTTRQFSPSAFRVVFLRKSHNLIYLVECKQGESFILRLTPKLHRSLNEIAGELEFQRYLFENGAPVAAPICTGDHYIVPITIRGLAYFASAFTLAKGRNWNERCDHTPENFHQIGKALGQIHKLSKEYIPSGTKRRRQWHESQHLLRAPALLKAYNPLLCEAFTRFMAEMNTFPAGNADFGLTHGDYLLSNYMITEDRRVTVFDFDECEYSWYAVDLAICMHCYLIGPEPALLPTLADSAESMLYHLLRGYISETPINRHMILSFQSFFKIRDFIYLSSILEKRERLAGWDKSFVETCMHRILNDKPFLTFSSERALGLIE